MSKLLEDLKRAEDERKPYDGADALAQLLWAALQSGDKTVFNLMFKAAVAQKPDGSRE